METKNTDQGCDTVYGVYNQDDDEMHLMNAEQVWDYLLNTSDLFQTSSFSVTTDGDTVMIYDVSAGANGKLEEIPLDEFYRSFGEDSLIIRGITDCEEI